MTQVPPPDYARHETPRKQPLLKTRMLVLVALALALTATLTSPAEAAPTMTGKQARKLITKAGCKEAYSYAKLVDVVFRNQEPVKVTDLDQVWLAEISVALNKSARVFDSTGTIYWWPTWGLGPERRSTRCRNLAPRRRA